MPPHPVSGTIEGTQRRPRPSLRAFAGATDGVALVEFAMIGPPFFLLIGGIIQFAFIIYAQQNLDFAVQRAVRALLTGTFQTGNVGTTNSATLLTNLKTAMCGSGATANATLFPCANVKLNVGVSSKFASGSYADAYDASTKAIRSSFESYTCARPKEIVVVTAAITVPTFFGKMFPDLSGMSDGTYLLQSRAVFRTEPYSATSSCS